ncbi:hypothetical protein DICSQDRAFT_150620 [Dichomitus squalens LYAD-421 SS1]|uniref:Uncharacterized protein n=1 Tax=Dichomitus squalens (strain LYAD-421) TaxID=732165 RepID=R7SIU3_DICSQ|nr:uncharacterized protein DICSQDRAFT_150620 [Dichomitus squalens LYAD-421 SS1]EJF56064.1 hypothetical protein DICSQDRAFT_150620 [Dichomitus squalens LYAD-421 SS1]
MAQATYASPGFDTFFSPVDPELDVRRDIALLLYLLSHTKVQGRRSGAEAKTLEALDPWTYLAFIINTGQTPHDKVIAVTGRIDCEGITAALCHVHDIITALNYFVHSSPASLAEKTNQEGHQTALFFFFIAKRCCLKLHARIANGQRMWSAHPTYLIRAWYVSHHSQSVIGLPAVLEQILEKHHQLSPARDHHGLSGDRIPYTIGPEDVLLWAGMLNGVFDILITDELALDLRKKYMDAVGKSHRPMLNSLFTSLGTSREGVVSEDIGTAAADTAAVEDPDHVIRYLKTLVIPLAAAQFLVHYCHKLSPLSPGLEAFMVYATSSTPTITQGHIQDFKNRFLQRFLFSEEDKEEIDQALSSLRFRYNGSLHAESIIMALACSVRESAKAEDAALQQQLSDIRPVFEVSLIPIGVSKKCCFCCDLLASLLTSSGEHERNLTFLLQGTHSAIFPWIPPDGVPFKVLKEIRIQLLRIFYDPITVYVNSAPSLQTSPAKPVRELPPIWSTDDMGMLQYNVAQ